MTIFGDLVYQLGGASVSRFSGNINFGAGDVYFVNAAHGSAGSSGKKPDQALKILGDAYDKTTNNNNDIVVLIADSSGAQIGESTDTSGLTWSNSYTHLIGAAAPTMFGKRARIFHNFNASPIWTISGSGCSFENVYFSHGRGSTTNKIGVQISGDYNYFGNFHFHGPAHNTDGNQTTYSMVTITSASEACTFDSCLFGTLNKQLGNGATTLTLNGGKHTWIRNCDFIGQASNAGATFVEIGASGQYLAIFENVSFINISGTSMTQAIDSNIADTTNCKTVIKGSLVTVGCTDVADATGDGQIWVQPYTATANAIGLGINPAVS